MTSSDANDSDDASWFVDAMFKVVPPSERIITCAFAGDPNSVDKNKWKPRPLALGDRIPFPSSWNVYACVSTFGRAPDGTWRRRREGYAASHALMVDDVGTKVSKKVAKVMKPSAIVETSEGNFQLWYFFAEPLRDAKEFGDMVDAFIKGKLLTKDPGMAGFNRVGRLPGFTNGKKTANGWRVRLDSINESIRYAPAEIWEGFKLTRPKRSARVLFDEAHTEAGTPIESIRERIKTFEAFMAHFKRWKIVQHWREPDAGGWIEIRCPWRSEHTAGADTGAAIRMPSEENAYHGAFRCHHGHCADRGWKELTDWVVDQLGEQFNDQNDE